MSSAIEKLARKQFELEELMKKVIAQAEIATNVYRENREPLERGMRVLREEMLARWRGLAEKVAALEKGVG
jgi:hypothetical protein